MKLNDPEGEMNCVGVKLLKFRALMRKNFLIEKRNIALVGEATKRLHICKYLPARRDSNCDFAVFLNSGNVRSTF